jgi:hypothetical protein
MSGGEGVSQPPLKDKAFSAFRNQTHHLSYGRKMGLAAGKNLLRQWPVIDNEMQIAVAPLSLIAVQSFRGIRSRLIQVLVRPLANSATYRKGCLPEWRGSLMPGST